MDKIKAVSLLSGGLDSILSTLIIQRLGIHVTAIKFLTPFGCDIGDSSGCGFDATGLAAKFKFDLKLSPLAEPYIEMVRNPAHGRGKNMNPCIDCRIFMLKYAKEFMKQIGAHFIVTGEVLNQRPMSQNKPMLMEVEKESGLKGLLLRPLSAKLLDPTIPEINGWVDREKLYGISGRSRKEQYKIAKEFGLESGEFGQPAGGCLLTDPGYSRRLAELWKVNPKAGAEDILLLKIGRHFRLPSNAKIVVGRNEEENIFIEGLALAGDVIVRTVDIPGPTCLLRGSGGYNDLKTALALALKYSDAKTDACVELLEKHGDLLITKDRILVLKSEVEAAVAQARHII